MARILRRRRWCRLRFAIGTVVGWLLVLALSAGFWGLLLVGARSALAEESNVARHGNFSLAPSPHWWTDAAYTLHLSFPAGSTSQYRFDYGCQGVGVTNGSGWGGTTSTSTDTLMAVFVPTPPTQCIAAPTLPRMLYLLRRTITAGLPVDAHVASFFEPGYSLAGPSPSPSVSPSPPLFSGSCDSERGLYRRPSPSPAPTASPAACAVSLLDTVGLQTVALDQTQYRTMSMFGGVLVILLGSAWVWWFGRPYRLGRVHSP